MRIKITARLNNYAHVNATKYIDVDWEDIRNTSGDEVDENKLDEIVAEYLNDYPMWEYTYKLVEVKS